MLKNTSDSYGWVSIVLHWLTAITVVTLFALGLWMESFDYDHPLYKTVPHIHKSIGFCLMCVIIFRLMWRTFVGVPHSMTNHLKWEKITSKVVHGVLYFVMLLMLPTGYLITTAKGQSLDVFNWFSLPPLITGVDNLEELAGEIHEILAFTIMGVAFIHACGALKHHYIDKDITLLRMIFPGKHQRKLKT